VRRILLPTLVVVLAAVPAASEAAVRHVVRGAGYGHGAGMSQYGAYGFALRGSDYAEILAHYYRGTELSTAPSRPVRVLLQPVDPYIRVRGANSANGRGLSAGATYVARPSGSLIRLTTAGGRTIARFSAPLRFKGPGAVRLLGPALNGISDGLYRGAIDVVPEAGGLTAVNVLDLDSYVRGVVAGEMPSSWPLEALKAQAVTARTYALATRKGGGIFDQYPDTRSQVYRGVTGESVRSDAAVAQTAGRIVTYDGVPAVTYFFSTSGGHTENVEYSSIGSTLSRPWLVGVPDPYDGLSPHHRWQVSFSTATLTRALGSPGTFRRLEVLKRGASPRVVSARVVGSSGSTTITGPAIRARLGLRDTWLTIVSVSSSARRAALVRPASWSSDAKESLVGDFWPARRRALVGRFWPAPRERRLRIERRAGGRWHDATFARTDRRGRYRRELERAGVYRVRAGSVAGPSVRIR
jgi:stage II sporulation protein D